MNFYWSHAIPLKKLSNERSYKFNWILTLTEVISIRNLRFFARLKKWRPLNSAYAAEPKRHIKKLFATTDRQTDRRRRETDETAFQYSRLWVNEMKWNEIVYKESDEMKKDGCLLKSDAITKFSCARFLSANFQERENCNAALLCVDNPSLFSKIIHYFSEN